MKATITISMDNAAFEEDAGAELSRILQDAAKKVQDFRTTDLDSYDRYHNLKDVNGNTVGKLAITGQ